MASPGPERKRFGTAPDGSAVDRVRIARGGLAASIMSWGAALCDLRLDGFDFPLILGLTHFEDYLSHSPYFGAVVGRYANRIAHRRCSIDGVDYRFDRDSAEKHLLHGGSRGTDKRNWTFAEVSQDSARLILTDRDGEMGFPGTCQLSATYRLVGDGVLALDLEATTDRPTPLNLAGHAYFNLEGSGTILDHELRIDAESYLPVDEELIPTGQVRHVEGTPFDFRVARPIRQKRGGEPVIYDHNFCLSGARVAMREVAKLRAPRSGIAMTLATTEPGLQFFAGYNTALPVPGLNGGLYETCAGLCLEPQLWPDTPNRPDFPNAILRPGERCRQQTEYRFERRA